MSKRVVLLTGAAGGIGQVMAAALLADGHSVAAVDRDAAGLERLATRMKGSAGAGAHLHPIVADLQSERACETAVEDARARFGAVDAVINNAGIGMSSIRPDAEARYPGIMGPPTRGLVSAASDNFSGQRITAARWDAALPGGEAARRASRAIGWPE